jgi:hypothetical protein
MLSFLGIRLRLSWIKIFKFNAEHCLFTALNLCPWKNVTAEKVADPSYRRDGFSETFMAREKKEMVESGGGGRGSCKEVYHQSSHSCWLFSTLQSQIRALYRQPLASHLDCTFGNRHGWFLVLCRGRK